MAARGKRCLLITAEGIEELAALGFRSIYGALGENLTTRGIGSPRIADRPALARRSSRDRNHQSPRPCADALDVYGPDSGGDLRPDVKAGDPLSPSGA